MYIYIYRIIYIRIQQGHTLIIVVQCSTYLYRHILRCIESVRLEAMPGTVITFEDSVLTSKQQFGDVPPDVFDLAALLLLVLFNQVFLSPEKKNRKKTGTCSRMEQDRID